MIPPRETERLLVAAITAAALARTGQEQIGYDWLHAGLVQARDYEREGHTWAPLLVERWQQVLDAYCAEFDHLPHDQGVLRA